VLGRRKPDVMGMIAGHLRLRRQFSLAAQPIAIMGVGAGMYAAPAVVPARCRLSLLADVPLTLVGIPI
jgi:hypothetical protein